MSSFDQYEDEWWCSNEEHAEWNNDSSGDDEESTIDVSEAIRNMSEFLDNDAIEKKKDDAVLQQMMGTVSAEKDAAAKQVVCIAMVGLILGKKRRREMAVRNILLSNMAVLESYVRFRGGMQSLRVYNIHGKFDLDAFGEKETQSWFRMSRSELVRLSRALGIQEEIVTSERDRCSGLEALCMLCMYYSFPTRRFMMVPFFGTSTSRISRIIATLRSFLYEKFSPGLAHPPQLSAHKLQEFASAVYRVCEVPHIFSFIDGTVRPTAKPEINQGVMYNGKDRVHALKYQCLCTPDGIMRHVTGPYCGSRHDQHMVHKSAVLDWVTNHPRTRDGHMYVTYADAGYAVAPGLMRPYPDGAVNIAHKAFNDILTSVRVCVEWEFGDVVVNWASVNYVPGQKILSGSRPGQQYIVAALLSNCQNCLRGSQTSKYFNCDPPNLEEYLDSLLKGH